MALERTLSIVKPDAVEKNHTGAIIARLEQEGFIVRAMKRVHLTRAEAEGFYAEHRGRGFFDELCSFMSRSSIVIMALEREDAIAKYREVIGATNPANAAEGTSLILSFLVEGERRDERSFERGEGLAERLARGDHLAPRLREGARSDAA